MLLGRRPFVAGAVPRLGIPGIRFSDGARGVVIGASTAFPVTMARAATWDPDARRRRSAARSASRPVRAAPTTRRPCASTCCGTPRGVARRSATARTPVLTGRMGSAMTRGLRDERDGLRQALRAQLDGERALRGRRLGRRSRAARGLPAALQGGRGCRGRLADDRLQPRARRVHGRERRPAHRCAARRVGLHRLRDERLGVRHARRGREPARPAWTSRCRCGCAAPASCPPRCDQGLVTRATVLQSAHRILRTSVLHAATRATSTSPTLDVIASPAHRDARPTGRRGVDRAAEERAGRARRRCCRSSRRPPAHRGRRPPRRQGQPRRPRLVAGAAAVDGLAAAGSARGAARACRSRTPSGRERPRGGRRGIRRGGRRGRRRRPRPARRGRVGRHRRRRGRRARQRLRLGSAARAARPPSRTSRRGSCAAATAARSSCGRPTSSSSARSTAANPRTVVVLIGGSAILTEAWRERVPALLRRLVRRDGGRPRARRAC